MTARVVQIGNCTLIEGDMRDELPRLTERAALILTDPPYRLTSGGKNGEMGGCFSKDSYDNSGELFPIVEWACLAPLLFAAARDDADAIVMANDKNLTDAETALRGAGFGHHRTLVWDKRSVTPNRWFMQGLEFGLYMWRGRARPINDKAAHPLMTLSHRDETLHPTEKPVAMLRRWIELTTAPGDLVIDPFMGSGSTAIAAMQAGRRFIGIEVMPRWFDVAVARVARAKAGQQFELDMTGAA
jgi:site-specific DNA-methyltransferase (adenine-specific)